MKPSPEDLDDFAKKVVEFSIPIEDPTCPEHCYSCCVNPVQHPRHYANIHYLVALLIALCNTCGGVVFLTASEGMSPGKCTFSTFEKRLREMLNTFHFPEGLIKMYKCDAIFWGIIVSKNSHESRLLYHVGRKVLNFQIDVHRQLHFENVPVKTHEVSDNVGPNKEQNVLRDDSNLSLESEDVSSSDPPADMEFSELTWDRNKGNWRGILKTTDQSFDNFVSSCDIWKPSSPMQMTPDEQSVKYLFQSHTDCSEVIARLKTEVPGFAIAHISWLSFLPEHDVEAQLSSV